MRKTTAAIIAATLTCAAPMTHAADENLTLASPELVAAAGFAPGSIVYVAAPAEAPSEFYGSQPAMTMFAGNQFQGRVSTYAYTSPDGAGTVAYASGDTFADAVLDLPSGVVLDNVRWWAIDAVAGDLSFFMIRSCLPAAGPGSTVNTILANNATTGTAGNQSAVLAIPGAVVIDNNTCHYWFRASFGGTVGLAVQKARVQWHRQVSAAPATATFPIDVPTTHPFFRFVEAMAASGLTGGCGAGTFCPDTAVTRGQLSVFFAVALGLHFPN